MRIDATCITNIFSFRLHTAITNFFLLVIYTYQLLDIAFVVVYLFYFSLFSTNYISIFLRMRKNIFNNIFLLMLAKKKIF